MNPFKISDTAMVVTSSYVTTEGFPILQVSHEDDEEGGSLWQFHCGNGDYSMAKMELVRLDTILKLDPSITEVLPLKMGQVATRSSANSPWVLSE